MDDEDLVEVAIAYTSRHALDVRELLGSGVHGIVYVVESKIDPGRRAVKLHRDSDAYLREKTAYERLSEKRVDTILGFQVPVPLRFDDEFPHSRRRYGRDDRQSLGASCCRGP